MCDMRVIELPTMTDVYPDSYQGLERVLNLVSSLDRRPVLVDCHVDTITS